MSGVNIRVTVKVPKEILSSSFVRAEIEKMQRNKTGPELRKEFKKTVEGWATAPDFSQKFKNGTDAVSVTVWPTGTGAKIYNLVNLGSPSHTITPKGRGVLRFQTGYRAATSPRVIGSRGNSRFGNMISTNLVHHPGFSAREFDSTIAEQYADTFTADMQAAIHLAAGRK